MNNQLILGDSFEILKSFPDNSFDAIITDPPYGLKFMGKKWDYQIPSVELWKEVLRVLKPGGHALVACGTRTQHRMAVNLEDSGFEIRDIISWLHGMGFPKSVNLGSGKGTALKPAQELFTLCRKPLSEKTIVDNVLKWGTGGLNIDDCRVGTETIKTQGGDKFPNNYGTFNRCQESYHQGRFPANVIHDGSEEVVIQFPYTSTHSTGQQDLSQYKGSKWTNGIRTKTIASSYLANSGLASRFFYCAKASPRERRSYNNHPTVKPIALMKYLIELITPKGGIVLDPFGGSGTTAIACLETGRRYVVIEKEQEYYEIAKQRIDDWEKENKQLELDVI